ncbi:MAG TPA: acyl-CoA synthetase, partial [Myxococcota bacterium]|nr:acyl-CoA synthetase [Myxococcota bacterium]
YFLAAGGEARRAARGYLRRCLGREPTLAETYRLFFTFAATVHDRIYFLKGRFELFDIAVHGAGAFDERGALLLGAHFGSFEALRASGKAIGQRRVAMAMYEDNARKINAVLGALAPGATGDIVALGRVDSMIRLAERLDAGALVGVLADRTLGGEAVARVPFLGEPAPFPTGPMRMAAALRQRVFFMAAVHGGGSRYDIHFEPLADFSGLEGLARAERERHVAAAVAAYAAGLERHARAAPYNWFNFFDFWNAR